MPPVRTSRQLQSATDGWIVLYFGRLVLSPKIHQLAGSDAPTHLLYIIVLPRHLEGERDFWELQHPCLLISLETIDDNNVMNFNLAEIIIYTAYNKYVIYYYFIRSTYVIRVKG